VEGDEPNVKSAELREPKLAGGLWLKDIVDGDIITGSGKRARQSGASGNTVRVLGALFSCWDLRVSQAGDNEITDGIQLDVNGTDPRLAPEASNGCLSDAGCATEKHDHFSVIPLPE